MTTDVDYKMLIVSENPALVSFDSLPVRSYLRQQVHTRAFDIDATH